MLYVSAYNKQKKLYAVTDTDDNTVTWIPKEELLKAHNDTAPKGYPIRGVTPEGIRILKLKTKSSFIDNMKSWIAKAKSLGIFEDFKFKYDYRNLVEYVGTQRIINIPPVREINAKCFKRLAHVPCKFILPGSVEVIEDFAFAGMEFSPGSKFDFSSLVRVGECAFNESQFVDDTVLQLDFPRLQSVGDSAFRNSRWVGGLKFGDELLKIGSYSFRNCFNLRTADLGHAVREINSQAFCECTQLFDVIVPASVCSVKEDAFSISVSSSFATDYQYSITIEGDKDFSKAISGRSEFRI